MSNLNKALLIGRLTIDPEMRYTPSGTAVTNFSIATNRWSSGPEGDRKELTDYHNIVANDVQFLDSRSSTPPSDGTPPRQRPAASDDTIPAPDDAPRDVDPDEIPF